MLVNCDERGKIVAGLVRYQGKMTPVGDFDYLPAPYGKGKGKLEPAENSDPEAIELSDVFPNLHDASDQAAISERSRVIDLDEMHLNGAFVGTDI